MGQTFTSEQRAEITSAKLASVIDPTRSTISAAQPVFTVEASAGDVTGTAAVGFQYRDLTFDTKVTGPVNKSTGEAQFADLDGLRNQSNVDVGFQYSYWNVDDPAPVLLPACRKLANLRGIDVKAVDCTLSNLRKEQNALNVHLVPDVDPGNVVVVGTRYKVGRKDFEFSLPSDLSEQSESHTSWSYTVGTALVTRRNLLLGGGYRREIRFVPASDPVQLCQTLNVRAETCTEATLGAPVRREGNQIYVEGRRFLGAVAVSPRLTRDFTHDVTGLEVPVYFLKNTSGGFTGGIRAGWRSDRPGLTVVGFVGQVLGLLTVP